MAETKVSTAEPEPKAPAQEPEEPRSRSWREVLRSAEIDARISDCLAPGWTLPRIPRVDRNVLRIAVFEIDYGEVPDAVAVTEAVQLVSELSTDESPAFVNGLLRAITAGDVRRTTF